MADTIIRVSGCSRSELGSDRGRRAPADVGDERLHRVLRAMANQTNLRILQALVRGATHPSELAGRSKYDQYWISGLGEIKGILGQAAQRGHAKEMDVPGLRSHGSRDSWYDTVTLTPRRVEKVAMAQARSLGRVLLNSGLLDGFASRRFRLVIARGLRAMLFSQSPAMLIRGRRVKKGAGVEVPQLKLQYH